MATLFFKGPSLISLLWSLFTGRPLTVSYASHGGQKRLELHVAQVKLNPSFNWGFEGHALDEHGFKFRGYTMFGKGHLDWYGPTNTKFVSGPTREELFSVLSTPDGSFKAITFVDQQGDRHLLDLRGMKEAGRGSWTEKTGWTDEVWELSCMDRSFTTANMGFWTIKYSTRTGQGEVLDYHCPS